MKTERVGVVSAFVALGMMWGSSFYWIHISIVELAPTTALAYRMTIGAVLMLAYLSFVARKRLPSSPVRLAPLAALGLINAALPNYLIAWAELHIDTATASVLNSLAPIFTLLIAAWVFRIERAGLTRTLGIMIGFLGALVLASREFGLSGSGVSLIGATAVVGAAISYAAGNVYTRQQVVGADRHVIAAGTLVFASIFSWLFAVATPYPVTFPSRGDTLAALAWLGLFSSFLAYLAYFYLIDRLGATRTSTVTYLFPIVGVSLGVILLGEHADLRLFGGALLVLIGLAMGSAGTSSVRRSLPAARRLWWRAIRPRH